MVKSSLSPFLSSGRTQMEMVIKDRLKAICARR